MADSTKQRRAATTKSEDAATGDVNRGVSNPVPAAGMTEDQRRAEGVDASQVAGPHDYSPEANPLGGAAGGSIDTYAGMPVAYHENAGPDRMQPLVLGQAPVAPAFPTRGSDNTGEKFHPAFPNAINRSPVVRGVEMDIRNAPDHPEHDQADKTHPDYGKPVEQHVGRRTEAPSFQDLKVQAMRDEVKAEPEPEAA